MGEILEATCENCSYQKQFRLGIGMMYGSLDDLSSESNPLTILDLIHSEKMQAEVVQLITTQNGTIDSRKDAGYALFVCERCKTIHSRFFFRLRHNKGVYVPSYCCPECERHLKQIDPETVKQEKRRFTCPKCSQKKAVIVAETTSLWD